MHKSRVVWPHAQAHLTYGFQERQGFDVTHCAANFHNGDFYSIRCTYTCTALDEVLDFVGDVGNHLHRGAQIIATTLFLQNTFVDLTGGEVVGAAHPRGDEALIVA